MNSKPRIHVFPATQKSIFYFRERRFAITYMASTLLKAIEGTDVQRRLLRLEEARLAKVDAS